MRTDFDFTPYRRSTVGFDHLFDLLEKGQRSETSDGYPAFDIVREADDRFRITLAVPGFKPDEIEIVAQQNQLSVSGKPAEEDEKRSYLHRGIARRAFERHFQLADLDIVGELRRRPAGDRAQPGHSRGDETAQDRDRQRRCRTAPDRRVQREEPRKRVKSGGVAAGGAAPQS